ncbi:hypothetical protein BH23VER1_BH23VER1_24780 [soil metagenome]
MVISLWTVFSAAPSLLGLAALGLGLTSTSLSAQAIDFGKHYLVPRGAEWSYYHEVDPPPADWAQPGFDDSAWASGAAPIGFGRPHVVTEVPIPAQRQITLYARKVITVQEGMLAQGYRSVLEFSRDDGIVVSINGTEVTRDNMPEGQVTHTTTALRANSETADSPYTSVSLSDATLLVPGENTIALEVHNYRITSVDLYFDLALSTGFVPKNDNADPLPLRQDFEAALKLGESAYSASLGSGELSVALVNDGRNAYFGVSQLDPITREDLGSHLLSTLGSSGAVGPSVLSVGPVDVCNHRDVALAFALRSFGNLSEAEVRVTAEWEIAGDQETGSAELISLALERQEAEPWVGPSDMVSYHVPTSQSDLTDVSGRFWTDPEFDDSTWLQGPQGIGYERASGYDDVIGTDVANLMYDINETALIRKSFVIDDLDDLAGIRLYLNWDDGYVLWINGVEASRDALRMPEGIPAWNAGALSSHADTDALVGTSIDLSPETSALFREGINTIAVHAANFRTISADFLFRFSLTPILLPSGSVVPYDDNPAAPLETVSSPPGAIPDEATSVRFLIESKPGRAGASIQIDDIEVSGTVIDPDRVTLSIPREVATIEPSTGASTVDFAVTLDAPASAPFTLTYVTHEVVDGATPGLDFANGSGSVAVAAGAVEASVPVTIFADVENEVEEAFAVVVRIDGDALLPRDTTIVRIADSGSLPPPTIQSFTVAPTGGGALLEWETSNATEVFLAPALGPVAASGTLAVAADVAAEYELVVRNGGGITRAFVSVLEPPQRLRPFPGSPAMAGQWGAWGERINTRGGSRVFALALAPARSLTVVVDPGRLLQPAVEIRDAGGNVLASATSTATGERVALETSLPSIDTDLTVHVTGADETLGAFSIFAATNLDFEGEQPGAASNGTPALAEVMPVMDSDGEAASIALQGHLGMDDIDFFKIDLAPQELLTLCLHDTSDSGANLTLSNVAGIEIANTDAVVAAGLSALTFRNGTAAATYNLVVTGGIGDYWVTGWKGAGSHLPLGIGNLSESPGFSAGTASISGVLGGRPSPPVTAALFGDFDTSGTDSLRVSEMVEGWNPDLILALGDQYYNTAVTQEQSIGYGYGSFVLGASDGSTPLFQSPIQRFFPALGNHDANGTGTSVTGGPFPNFLRYLVADPVRPRLPFGSGMISDHEMFYDFRWGAAHFFVLDSDHALDEAASLELQRDWLRTALQRSDATWKFVILHHAPFAPSRPGDHPDLRWDFASWGASAIFSAHDHVYERLHHEGIPYFVSGLGGRSIYGFAGENPGSKVRYNRTYGAIRMTFDGSTANVEFVSVGGPATAAGEGEIIDSVILTKPTLAGQSYPVTALAGDILIATTTTAPAGLDVSLGGRDLDPQLELYDPSGTLVALDEDGAPDGRNATFQHTATATGEYLVRVSAQGATSGAYLLDLTGASGTAPPFGVAEFLYDGGDAVVEFTRPVRFDSLGAGDLRMGGVASTAVVAESQSRFRFTLPAGFDSVMQAASLESGSIVALTGETFAGFVNEGYSGWATHHFGAAASDPDVAAPEADFNGDGIPNIFHFATGLDPRIAPSRPILAFEYRPTAARLTFSTLRRRDVRLILTRSTDLETWTTVPLLVELPTPDGMMKYSTTQGIFNGGRNYYRLEYSR